MQSIKVHELPLPTCVLLLSKNFDPSLFFNVAPSLSMFMSNLYFFYILSLPLHNLSLPLIKAFISLSNLSPFVINFHKRCESLDTKGGSIWLTLDVAPGFKDKTRYTPYVSLGSQISHIATNKGNINRQCLIYNILSIKDISLNNKQRKRQLRSSGEDSNSIGTTDWLITSLIPSNFSNLVPIRDFYPNI